MLPIELEGRLESVSTVKLARFVSVNKMPIKFHSRRVPSNKFTSNRLLLRCVSRSVGGGGGGEEHARLRLHNE